MEYKMVTIPFDLETAKKINIGERVGQIVTEKGRNRAEIVYIECNEKLIEVFKKGITVKLKYVEKRVLDTFTDNGIGLSNYTHCIIVKRNFYLAW